MNCRQRTSYGWAAAAVTYRISVRPSGTGWATSFYKVQLGLMPNNYKHMSSVGAGAVEIRVQDEDGIARLMYVAKFDDFVHVLHVFTKKTQTTPQSDIEIAKKRYGEAKSG